MGAGQRETRDRKRRLQVVVSASERATIEARAKATNLSVSAYLRECGLGHEPRSILDFEAVRGLLKVNADLGRMGGLLKLWLSDQPGVGAREGEVRDLLKKVEVAVAEIRDGIARV